MAPTSTGATRRTILTGGVAGVAAVVAGCGTSSPSGGAAPQPAKVTQPATLVYWTNLSGADGSRMKELAEQYQKETPLVTIEQIQGVNPYFDKVLAAVAAGNPPDVLGTRMPYVPFLAERGVIADLPARDLQQIGLRQEDFDPKVWQAGEWQGKRYSIPMDLNGIMLLYTEAAVRDAGGDPAKPPASWPEWVEWTNRLTKDDRYGSAYDFSGEALATTFMHHLHQQGGKVFAADGKKAAFNTPQGLAALTLLADVAQRAHLPLVAPPGQGAIDLFEQRKLISWLNGPWNLNRLAKPESPAAADLRVSLAPQFDPQKPAWMAQGFQLTLPKQPKPDEAKRAASFGLINFLFNHGYEWAQAGKIPASKKVLTSDQYQKSSDPVITHLRLWERYLPNATLIEVHPRFVDALAALHPELSKAVNRQQAPQAALQEGERAVNAVLAQ